MNSNLIFEVIERIAANASKKHKVAIIKEHADLDGFQAVLKAALEPTLSYYIAKLDVKGSGSREFDAATWMLLHALSTRDESGNAALRLVEGATSAMTPESAELLKRIILKDLRAGFSASTVNKAIPGLIQVFPYMRCSLPNKSKLSEFDWEIGAYSQLKANGMFGNLEITGSGDVSLHSRQGSVFPRTEFRELAEEARQVLNGGTQNHGELLVVQDGKVLHRKTGNGILNSVLAGGEFEAGQRPVMLLWDQIPLTAAEPKGRFEVGYGERYAALESQLGKVPCRDLSMIPTRVVYSYEEATIHYRALVAAGEEGTVVKDAHAPWMDGDSPYQVKLKGEFVCDLVIVGFVPGKATGKNADTFGSILARTSDGLLEVAVSGISYMLRADMHARREQFIGKVIAVKANEIMTPANDGALYSLFSPRVEELRMDKLEGDSLQQVKDQAEAALRAA